MRFLLTILGAMLVLEGLPYLAFPLRVKEWAALLQEVPERTLRIIGLLTMLAGMALMVILAVS